jgi:hypothetical protein
MSFKKTTTIASSVSHHGRPICLPCVLTSDSISFSTLWAHDSQGGILRCDAEEQAYA